MSHFEKIANFYRTCGVWNFKMEYFFWEFEKSDRMLNFWGQHAAAFFKLSKRTRMIDVKTNYKNKYLFNMQCRLCDEKDEEESEIHLIKCNKIMQHYSSSTIDLLNAKYDHIFSQNIEEQVQITKIYNLIFKTRSRLLN